MLPLWGAAGCRSATIATAARCTAAVAAAAGADTARHARRMTILSQQEARTTLRHRAVAAAVQRYKDASASAGGGAVADADAESREGDAAAGAASETPAAAAPSLDAVVPVADTPRITPVPGGEDSVAMSAAEAASDIMKGVVRDLAAAGRVHTETMKLIEKSEEWRDYDSHVAFELMVLKHRYQSSGEAMTPARRTQMQAHLRQKQTAVMEMHANAVADELLAGMTREERATLLARLSRFDAPAAAPAAAAPAALPQAAAGSTGRVTADALLPPSPRVGDGGDATLREALWELSAKVAAAGRTPAPPTHSVDNPARPEAAQRGAASARALAGHDDPMEARQRHFDDTTSLPFASPHATPRRRRRGT